MMNRTLLLILLASSLALLSITTAISSDMVVDAAEKIEEPVARTSTTAVFAGGCFWCIEADFEKLPGVNDVVSGYTGGSAETANYKSVSYTETGHFEAVQVNYDPDKVSYAELVDYFWRHIDPTDAKGQFCDKGSSYKSALFVSDAYQKNIAERSLAELRINKPFDAPIVTPILDAMPFYLAEDYHQDYYKKNPLRYRYYRNGCGRDKRVKELWGD